MDKEYVKNRILSITDPLWKELRTYNEEIIDFLVNGIQGKNIGKICHSSLKLVVAELKLKLNEYKKYKFNDCIPKDWFSMFLNNTKLDINNVEEVRKNMQEIREIMWGYISQYYEDIVNIFLRLSKDEEYNYSDKQRIHLTECICVAFIETNMRRKEIELFEKEIYDD